MIKTFTRNDIFRFLYGEMTGAEEDEFRMSLTSDNDLREDLQDFQTLKEDMEKTMISPPERTINSILEFSRNYNVKSIGR